MTAFPVLLIDVGNTNIDFGLALDASGKIESLSLPTEALGTSDALGLRAAEICRHAGLKPHDIRAWLVSSVVPHLDMPLAAAAKRFCGCEALFAGLELKLGLENRYERPQEVGADRLVTAFAATRTFDAPGFLVIDFGTATTFDCVIGNAYLGGLICPGVLSSAAALSTRTAKLPQADPRLATPEIAVGRSTAQSLNQGLVHGFAAMAEGLAARLTPTLPQGSMTVATGGLAQTLAAFCPAFDAVAPGLLLDGLRTAWLERS